MSLKMKILITVGIATGICQILIAMYQIGATSCLP